MSRGTAFVGSAIAAVDPGCPGNAKAVRRDGGGRRADDDVRRSFFFWGGEENCKGHGYLFCQLRT